MRRSLLGLVVAASIASAPWPGAPAAASCAAPYLRVAGTPPTLAPGSELVIEGRAFVEGCDDNRGTTAFGCSVDEPEPQEPLKEVTLRLHQGGRDWELGTADARSAATDELGHITWLVTLPDGVRPGAARLEADGSEPLTVEVGLP